MLKVELVGPGELLQQQLQLVPLALVFLEIILVLAAVVVLEMLQV